MKQYFVAMLKSAWIGLVAAFTVWTVQNSYSSSGEWELFDEYTGIKMFRKEVPGSPLLAYKGSGLIQAPLSKLATVIEDTPRKPQWMTRIKTAEVIKEISPYERIEYVHLKLPWPLKDRDFLYRTKIEFFQETQKVTFFFESVEHPARPVYPDRVRAHVYYGNFSLIAVEQGKKAMVEADAHADPKGLVPAWAVNLYQKRLPRESIEGLMRQVVKPWINEHPRVKKMLTDTKGAHLYSAKYEQ
jgi:hypothetical protein